MQMTLQEWNQLAAELNLRILRTQEEVEEIFLDDYPVVEENDEQFEQRSWK